MATAEPPYTGLTAGQIIEELKNLPPETDIHIEGIVFYRWKWRGENLLALELSEMDWEELGFWTIYLYNLSIDEVEA